MTFVQRLLKRFTKEEKGLTLIELLAVIVIIGVIAAIAVPMVGNLISKTKTDATKATANQIFEAARLYQTATSNSSTGTVNLSTLQTNGYIQNGITDPDSGAVLHGSSSVKLDPAAGEVAVTLLMGTGVTGTDPKTFTLAELK
jgi:type IV pilus assembly protein PilA